MGTRAILAVLLLSTGIVGATGDDLRSATQKIEAIKSDKLSAGASVDLSPRELNAWVQKQVPAGVRGATLRIDSPGVATGSAMVDIAAVSRSQGFDPGRLLGMLLEGEHTVKVSARIRSSGGTATVDVERVEISGLEIDGRMLEFLVRYVVVPIYPNATVGHPFELGHNIDRIDVRPAAVRVEIGPRR